MLLTKSILESLQSGGATTKASRKLKCVQDDPGKAQGGMTKLKDTIGKMKDQKAQILRLLSGKKGEHED
jgi:hypothetical protein